MHDELQPEVATRVILELKRAYFGRWRWRAVALVGTMVGLTYADLVLSPHIVSMLGAQRMAGWWGWLFPALYGGLLGLIVWGAIALERRFAAMRLWAALIRERHCPRCLYPLIGLQAESDGCTVCPECGAAWRLHSS